MRFFKSFLFFLICVFFISTATEVLGAKEKKPKPKKSKAPPVIVWNGDDIVGNAKGWAAPKAEEQKPSVSSIEPVEGEGKDGSVGLVWKAEGPEWKGFGWNWYGWWPSDAGTDISKHVYLVFWMKVKVDDPKLIPDLEALTVGIGSSGGSGEKATEWIPILPFAEGEDLLDGEWHKIKIPVDELALRPKSEGFDRKTTWELRMGIWSPEPQKFTIVLDNIGFE